jgi:hypothetical protein
MQKEIDVRMQNMLARLVILNNVVLGAKWFRGNKLIDSLKNNFDYAPCHSGLINNSDHVWQDESLGVSSKVTQQRARTPCPVSKYISYCAERENENNWFQLN